MKKKYLIYPLISLIFFVKPVKLFLHTVLAESVYIPVLKAEKFIEEVFMIHSEYERLNELLLMAMSQIDEQNRKRIFSIWREGLDTSFVLARALYFDPFGLVQKITLDKGLKDGVKYGMPVVYKGVLVGKVYYTSSNLSFVMTMYNDNFRVGVVDKRTGILGVYEGGSSPRLLYVPVWADVAKGDTLVTSGIGIIRGGIYVGRITSVEKTGKENFFYKIKVKPFWDFSSSGLFGIVK